MPTTPSAAAQAAALLAAANMANLPPANSPTTVWQTQLGLANPNLNPAAMFDALIALFGGQSTALIDTVGAGATFGATPIALASATLTTPMTRLYEFECDLAEVFNSTNSYAMGFTIRVDSTTTFSVSAARIIGSDLLRHQAHWHQRISLTAGSHLIEIMASSNSGFGTFDSASGLTVHVR